MRSDAADTIVQCTVPGKIMLAGEYAVLSGAPALAVTVDRTLTVRARRRSRPGAEIQSNLWASPREIANDTTSKAAMFKHADPLEAAVAFGLAHYGLEGALVQVTSEIEPTYGIGSSSALRLAVVMALSQLSALDDSDLNPWHAARQAFELQLHSQKQASGYDIATQLLGGLVRFTCSEQAAWPGDAQVLHRSDLPPDDLMTRLSQLVTPFVGGKGAPTAAVTTSTLTWLSDSGRLFKLTKVSNDLVDAFQAALASRSSQRLAAAVREHREVFADSPHFPKDIAAALAALPGEGRDWSFKTTGAGGEDAILVIGPSAATQEARRVLLAHGWHSLAPCFTSSGASVSMTRKPEDMVV